AQMSTDIREFATQKIPDDVWTELRARIYYCQGEFHTPETYARLKARLAELALKHRTQNNCLFYLATPPDYFVQIVQNLGSSGLVDETAGGWRRVIVEKPFGRDLDSARVMNKQIRDVLHERQVYR